MLPDELAGSAFTDLELLRQVRNGIPAAKPWS